MIASTRMFHPLKNILSRNVNKKIVGNRFPQATLSVCTPAQHTITRRTLFKFLQNKKEDVFEKNQVEDPTQYTLDRLDQDWIDSQYPIIEVESQTAVCDGTQFTNMDPTKGHPLEYIRVKYDGPERCKYCSLRFIRVKKKKAVKLPPWADEKNLDKCEGGDGDH